MSDTTDGGTRGPALKRCRQLIVILLATAAARGLFILLMPPAFSGDVVGWFKIAKSLAQGQNPYAATTYLNWPPLWMQIIWVMGHISYALHAPFPRVLQGTLILIEIVTVIALFRLLKLLAPRANAVAIIIVGISLNPVAILLICQHCNFDVLLALWVLLFLTHLILFHRHGDPVDFLAACLLLGLAVLTKTVPLVLLPLLARAFRDASAKARWLGGALLLGPVTLGMSIIYVLSPDAVSRNVIGYRSLGGYFGISGVLGLLKLAGLAAACAHVFPWLLLAVMAALSIGLWRRAALAGRDLVLLAALLLAAVPTFGPGYSPQYMYWYLPLLVVTYACYQGAWRKLLLAGYVIAGLTYAVEYGLFVTHGSFMVLMLPNAPGLRAWCEVLTTRRGQTLVRLPLFAAFIGLILGGAMLLRRADRSPTHA